MATVKLIEGVFTPEQKRDMFRKVTGAMGAIEGESLRPATSVLIEEVKSGEWGTGGEPLTAAEVKGRAAARPRQPTRVAV